MQVASEGFHSAFNQARLIWQTFSFPQNKNVPLGQMMKKQQNTALLVHEIACWWTTMNGILHVLLLCLLYQSKTSKCLDVLYHLTKVVTVYGMKYENWDMIVKNYT